MSVYGHVEQLIEDFCPDAIVPQVCDNSLSLISCLLAEKKNIFYCAEFVRPYMKNYQILINPRTFDNLQIKKMALQYFNNTTENSYNVPTIMGDFDKESPYFAVGFQKSKSTFKKKLKAIKYYKSLYGIGFFFRIIYLNVREFFKRDDNLSNSNYFLMPLHLQPEAVFLGTDNRFADQASLICYISYNLPVNFELLVKEHPAQKIRTLEFYRKI